MLLNTKVFLSHTSAASDFAVAAIEACNEAHRVPIDMRWFTAADRTPTANDARKVRECAVFVSILALDYGSPARDHPDCSHCELEWENATQHRIPRLAYLLAGESPDYRQEAFRRRVLDSGVTANFFTDAADLQHKLFKALSDDELFAAAASDDEPTDKLGAFEVTVEHNEGVIAQIVQGGITINKGRA
jgi:hypothetical protein